MPIRTVGVDVDGTLIDDKGLLFPGVKDKLEEWVEKYTLICWSNTGGEYAKRVCIKCGIDKYFKYFLDKPDVIVDNDPDSIFRSAAIIVITDPLTDWTKDDNTLFGSSRKHIKEYI